MMQKRVTARGRCAPTCCPVAGSAGVAVLGRAAAVGAPAAAVGDPAEFLDVDVDQLARCRGLVTDRFGFADGQPGRLVQKGKQRHPIPGQHSSDSRAGHSEVIADPMWTPPPSEPQRDDPPLESA
ncbi:hypothetical protein AWX17_27605 [Priestia megaterium]|nr:hypothetical protein AWX17_27605 [Priestia megaterium]